ncbi:MAG: type III pantothenate kinase [Candidatus Wallbacteria bacterium]|nr:type III pantothenate kinase [Candidatus Wallbacteria bacterium]
MAGAKKSGGSGEVTLALDVGNTQTVIGAFERHTLVLDWRISTDSKRTADEYRHLLHGFLADGGIRPERCRRALVSSVVPPVTRALEGLSKDLELFVVDWRSPFSFTNRARQPETVGADRLVNAEAALRLHGAPLIVVDSGTATTFCAINAEREYLGGAIAPGVSVAAEALFARASRLANVDLRRPGQVIGDTTESALQSGIILGHAAMIDGMVAMLRQELTPGPAAKCIGTGGWMDVLGPLCKTLDAIEPDLTLLGLLWVWENATEARRQ